MSWRNMPSTAHRKSPTRFGCSNSGIPLQHAPFITGPPTHSVGPILFCSPCVCRRLSSVGVCKTSRRNVTHQRTARDGPVVFVPSWRHLVFLQLAANMTCSQVRIIYIYNPHAHIPKI